MKRSRLFTTALLIIVSFFSFGNGFEQNNGQVKHPNGEKNTDVLYFFQEKGFKVSLRKNGFSYENTSIQNPKQLESINDPSVNIKLDYFQERIDFIFPKQPNEIVPSDKSPETVRYISENVKVSAKKYHTILYKNVQDGFDVEFKIVNGKFKYNIIKHEAVPLSDFYLEIRAKNEVSLINDHLKFNLEKCDLTENIPYSYEADSKMEKQISYELTGNKVFFKGPGIDVNEKLIIDPEPDMVWSSFFGGDQYDFITDTSIDENDTVYAVGITMSANNISTSGAFQTTYQGDLDVFISKFDLDGNQYWSTYYAGPQSERSYAITIDKNQSVFIAGSTFSTIGFATANAHQSNVDGADDIFIVEMNTNGLREWGTYHGGNGHDFVTDMQVEADTIYLVGHTTSSNNIATTGAHQDSYTANEAGHITLFNTDGQFLWGTYFGDAQNNSIEGVAITSNAIIATGRTTSSSGISTTGSHQETFGGFTDGFITSFSKSGVQNWGSYYGGQYTDVAKDIVLDTSNGFFIVGNTSSENNISTPGSYQETRLSSDQGFLVHFDKDGERLWGSYTGGTGADYLSAVEKDSRGFVILGGNTTSTDEIATPNTYQATLNSAYDGFIQRFNFDGTYDWGTYLGGPGNEDILSIEIDQKNNIIATGSTNQNDTIFSIGNSLNNQYNGGSLDGFIAYLCQQNPVEIYYDNDTLFTLGNADEYEWYLDGEPINEFGSYIVPQEDGDYTVNTSTNGNCSITSETYVHSTISLNQLKSEDSNVYPNPTEGIIIVENKTLSDIYVSDLTGRKLHTYENVKSVSIDLTMFSNGSYIITIKNEREIMQKTVIKI